jgi:hypothetical protein
LFKVEGTTSPTIMKKMTMKPHTAPNGLRRAKRQRPPTMRAGIDLSAWGTQPSISRDAASSCVAMTIGT